VDSVFMLPERNAGELASGRDRAARPESRTQVTPAPSASRSGCARPFGTPWNPGSMAFWRSGFPVSWRSALARRPAAAERL